MAPSNYPKKKAEDSSNDSKSSSDEETKRNNTTSKVKLNQNSESWENNNPPKYDSNQEFGYNENKNNYSNRGRARNSRGSERGGGYHPKNDYNNNDENHSKRGRARNSRGRGRGYYSKNNNYNNDHDNYNYNNSSNYNKSEENNDSSKRGSRNRGGRGNYDNRNENNREYYANYNANEGELSRKYDYNSRNSKTNLNEEKSENYQESQTKFHGDYKKKDSFKNNNSGRHYSKEKSRKEEEKNENNNYHKDFKKERKFFENFQIPDSLLLSKIDAKDLTFRKNNEQNPEDSSSDISETRDNISDMKSNIDNEISEMNDLIFENDENLVMKKTPIIVLLERKHGFLKQAMKERRRDVKIIRRDNIYYFKGENDVSIASVKQNMIDFMFQSKFPKFFKIKETGDPKLAMRSIVSSSYFKDEFFRIKRKYIQNKVHIEYLTSSEYYNELRLMSKRSKYFTEKLKKKPSNTGFIRIAITSDTSPGLINSAEEELRQAMQKLQHINDVFYFKIDLPNDKNLESNSKIRTDLIKKAGKEDIALSFLQTKKNDKDWFIEGFHGAIYKSKKIIKNFEFKNNLPIKAFCAFLEKLLKNEIKIKDDKEFLIYKHFLQKDFELKANKKGVNIKTDEQNLLLVFSKPCQFDKEISEALQNYDLHYLQLPCEIKSYDMPANMSELDLEEIYEKFEKMFKNPNQMCSIIEQEVNALNNSESSLKIFYQKNDLQKKKAMNFVFLFKIIYYKKINFNEKLKFVEKEFISFFEKIILTSLKTPKNFDGNKIINDFSCFYIEVDRPERLLFLIGNRKDIQSARIYLNSQKLVEKKRKDFNVPEIFNKIEAFKKFKKELKEKGILFKEDRLEIANSIMIFVSSQPEFEERFKKIQIQLKEFQNKSMIVNTIELFPHQIDYLNSNPNILRDFQNSFGVQVKMNTQNCRKLHFTLEYNNKRLNLLNNEIQSLEADAIVNSHSGVLIDSEWQSEGVNKQILMKAGPKYKLELANYIKLYKNLRETEVFTSSSGSMKTCKYIINVSTPIFNTNENYKEKLALAFKNIIVEADKYQLNSIAIPFIGAGTFGLPLEEIFRALLNSFQMNFFSSMTIKYLKEVNICEIDLNKIHEAKKLLKKYISKDMSVKRQSKFTWKWKDDHGVFQIYDDYINDKIDEAYENYIKINGTHKYDICLNIFKQPGTHQFDLKNMKVTDIAKGSTEVLQNKFDSWYHNSVIYSNEVSEILTKYQKSKELSFQLFLKRYTIDFKQMLQINIETNFQRTIEKYVQMKLNAPYYNNFQLLNYKNALVYENEQLESEGNLKNSLVFSSFLDKSKILEAQLELDKIFKKELDKMQITTYDLSEKKINELKTICLQEKIYVEGALKPNIACDIIINGSKNSLKIFNSELNKPDLPWDNVLGDSQCVVLSPTQEEYLMVSDNFKTTLANKIISIKRIQNNDLYISYQNNVKRAKERKIKQGMKLTGKEEFEKWLWHGTRTSDPQELAEKTTKGLSTQYASDSCMWGRGIYFAVNASYSNNYAFQKLNRKCLLLCKVFVGEYIYLPSDNTLKEPPAKIPGQKILYDSVQGQTGGSIVYILYENYWNYPFYLVEYEI